jgi:hypothetical protein
MSTNIGVTVYTIDPTNCNFVAFTISRIPLWRGGESTEIVQHHTTSTARVTYKRMSNNMVTSLAASAKVSNKLQAVAEVNKKSVC